MKEGGLPILIAGGGIGGLAAALALLRRGIDVVVYEQASQLKEIGAGVQISPNGARVLQDLGILDRLQETSCETHGKEIRLWCTGQSWPLFDLGNAAVEKFGFPYFTVYRVDLHNALMEAVLRLKPEAIRLASPCSGFEQYGESVALHLKSGEIVQGAALIGADGINSAIRQAMFGLDRTELAEMSVWRGVIPMEKVPAHLRRQVGVNWVGPGGHVVHYPLRNGELMNFGGCLEKPMKLADSSGIKGTTQQCLQDFQGWHSDVLTLIEGVQTPIKWGIVRRALTQEWTQKRVSLLGDACHAMFPFLAQGAVMAMEDGLILARCLASEGRVETALQRYEAARKQRTYAVAEGSSDNAARFHSRALADPVDGAAHIEREWATQKVSARYDWIFAYDAATVAI